MKKAVAALLSLVLCLGLVGCGGTRTEIREETKTGSYSRVWEAGTDGDVQHDTGALAIDSGWGAVVGVSEVGAMCSAKTETLRAPAYLAAARLLVSEQNMNSKNVAAVLRVLDADGNELGRENVRVCDFDASLTYQDFTFVFPVEEETEATFEIYWPGTNYVRVSEFGIMSKKAENIPDYAAAGEAALGVKEAEQDASIVYEDGALYYFDLFDWMTANAAHAEEQYDIANLVCTLQGLANRDGEHIYLRFRNPDDRFPADTDSEWLKYLTADGGWLADKKVVTVHSPMTLLRLFASSYQGFAAWDGAVPATVNAAATACGVENLLPVRYSTVRNSLYYYVTHAEAFADKPVKVDLGGKFTGKGKIFGTELDSTGSRKNDVYLWAKAQYLDTHKVNSHLMAYHVDAHASNTVFAPYGDLQNMYLSNRDYYIANRAFFFDLSPLIAQVPDDDPEQLALFGGSTQITDGTSIDYATFTSIMEAQARYAESADAAKPIDVGGFTPWHLKYTKFTNPDAMREVDAEWETVRMFSIYNAYVNADAPSYTAMTNASVFQHYPMKDSYTQKGNKTVTETLPTAQERGVNYLLFYMGDYDASAWLNTTMTKLWGDSNRGKLPLCWTFALDIVKRAGHVVDMMYGTATENDYFVAGDNGVGYLNPSAFKAAASKDIYGDLDSWAEYNRKAYERFDIDYTGFLILDSLANVTQDIIECYAKFCKGLATNFQYAGERVEGIETVGSVDANDLNADAFISHANVTPMEIGSRSTFTQLRFILNTPTDVLTFYNRLTEQYPEYNFKVVDPYTFYTLLAQQNNG